MSSKSYKIRIEVAIHILIWVVLFYIPVALSTGTGTGLKEIALFFWLQLLFMAVIFYLNFLGLVERFLFKKRWLLFILVNLCLFAFLYWSKHEIISSWMGQPADGHAGPPVVFIWYSDFLIYLIPIAFAVAIRAGRRLTNLEVYRTEAENAKLQAELQTLKFQLQPHFFFNALNNIYSLIETEPEKARNSIHSLSRLMRHLLDVSNKTTISLKEEIDFVNKYIALMRVRLTGLTQITAVFPTDSQGIQIPPLLFISIVENAFKHGVSTTQPGNIYFNMHVSDDNLLVFRSSNNNFSKQKSDLSGTGIGLENLRKRLTLLYPDRYVLDTHTENDQFVVILEIDLKTETP